MGITREDVLHVARLARLRLEPDEVARFTDQLNGILEHLAALQAVPASQDVEARTFERAAPLRADEIGKDALGLLPERLAPSWQSGFFTVPRLGAMDAAQELEGG